MKVTVRETEPGVGFRVVHEGVGYLPGETADVPNEVAQDWGAKGWIDPPLIEPKPPEPVEFDEYIAEQRKANQPKQKPRASGVTFKTETK